MILRKMKEFSTVYSNFKKWKSFIIDIFINNNDNVNNNEKDYLTCKISEREI